LILLTVGVSTVLDLAVLSYFKEALIDATSEGQKTFETNIYTSLGHIGGVFLILLRLFLFTISIYLQAIFIKSLNNWFKNRLTQNFLFTQFEEFEHINPSEKTRFIVTEVNNIATNVFYYGIQAISDIIPLTVILIYLGYTVGIDVLLTLPVFATIVWISYTYLKPKMVFWGAKRVEYEQTQMQKATFAFSARKYILANNLREKVSRELAVIYDKLALSNLMQMILFNLPRLLIESLAFLLLLTLIYISTAREQFDLPGLLIIGLAALRLLPSINRLLLALQALKFASPLIAQISPLIVPFKKYKLPRPTIDPANQNMVTILELHHQFCGTVVFQGLNHAIARGEKVLIAGKSGQGKTTLVDIISGIRTPTSGSVKVGTSRIQYLTQDTFVPDGTYQEVICDNSEFELTKFQACLDIANINWLTPDQLLNQLTVIADGASNLSGGQRQRIALARALYQQPELYILDEATSGIDEETEIEIFSKLLSLDVTILCVTHSKHLHDLFHRKIEL